MAAPKTPTPKPPVSHLRELVSLPGWAHLVEHCLEQLARYEVMQDQWQLPAEMRAHIRGKAHALREDVLDWAYAMADQVQESPFTRHGQALLHVVRLQTGVVEAMQEVPVEVPAADVPAAAVTPRRRAGWTA